MSLLGTGAPACIFRGQLIYFPSPIKGSRDEDFKDETESVTNVLGSRIKFAKKLRWYGKYEFALPSPDIFDTLIAAFNSGAHITWIPHIDVPFIRYPVDLEKVKPSPVQGDPRFLNVKVEVLAVNLSSKRPSLDNMISAISPFNVAKLRRS